MNFSSFNERTQADMEVALERACDLLPKELNTHDVRRHIASEIMSAAQRGQCSLSRLTYVGEKALKEFCLAQGIRLKQSA
jgi:hypothetical protein